MKKNYFILATTVIILLVSCQKSALLSDEPRLKESSKPVNAAKGVAPSIFHTSVPIDIFSPSPCSGQMVHWVGEFKSIAQIIVVNNTGKVTGKVTSTGITHLKGVDEAGNVYNINSQQIDHFIFDFIDQQYNHVHYISRQVGTSSGNGTFLFYYTQRLTITPNGEVKAELTDTQFDCK